MSRDSKLEVQYLHIGKSFGVIILKATNGSLLSLGLEESSIKSLFYRIMMFRIRIMLFSIRIMMSLFTYYYFTLQGLHFVK
jgi:hypothetical protein